jgi:hypothetical protein
LFQDRLLRDFYTIGTPLFLGALRSTMATVWVTPMAPVCLACCQVTNILPFHFSAPSVRFAVVGVSPFVFAFEVANKTVATVIFLQGSVG